MDNLQREHFGNGLTLNFFFFLFFGGGGCAHRYRILHVSMLYDISKSFLLYINLCVLSFVCHVKMKNCYPHCNDPIIGCQRNKIIFKYQNNMKSTYLILVSSVQQYLHPVYTSVLFI
jgi:hypothetical protein